jgi:hypothetical protein
MLFAILGFSSLLCISLLHARLCQAIPVFQLCRSGFHGCDLDCSQSWSRPEQIKAFLFFFSPVIGFAMTAFIFSKRPHRFFVWSVLLIGLVTMHAVLLFVGYFVSA